MERTSESHPRAATGPPKKQRSKCRSTSTARDRHRFRPESRSMTTCSINWVATAGSTWLYRLRVTSTSTPTTPSKTLRSRSARHSQKRLGDKAGVRRFASGRYPLDEALIDVALDLSGRPHVEWHVEIPESLPLGNPAFDPQLAEHAVSSFATAAGITLHVELVRGNQYSPCDRGNIQRSRADTARRGAS